MKCYFVLNLPKDQRRPPHGGRGLKLEHCVLQHEEAQSPPTRGAWIEIPRSARLGLCFVRRPPHGGRGLKYFIRQLLTLKKQVAPHTGGVD